MRKILAFVVFSLWVVGVGSAAQIPSTVDYDNFYKLNEQGRISFFNQITPENRAALVLEHFDRWVEANRTRLTPQQLEQVKAYAALMTAHKYPMPVRDQLLKEVEEIQARNLVLFSREELRQMTIRGNYIPKKAAGSAGNPR